MKKSILVPTILLLTTASASYAEDRRTYELSAGGGATEVGGGASVTASTEKGGTGGTFELQGGHRPLRLFTDFHIGKNAYSLKSWNSPGRSLDLALAYEKFGARIQTTFNDFDFAKDGTECFGNAHLLLSSEIGLQLSGSRRIGKEGKILVQGKLRATVGAMSGAAYDSDAIAAVLGVMGRTEGELELIFNRKDALKVHANSIYVRDLAREATIANIGKTAGNIYIADANLTYTRTLKALSSRPGPKIFVRGTVEFTDTDVLPTGYSPNAFSGISFFGGVRAGVGL